MAGGALIIVNPAAGGGRDLRLIPWIRERLSGRDDVELEVTGMPGDAERLAADASRAGRERVVAVGGDGTIQEVLNGIMTTDRRTALGVVPVGTGNDLARSLAIPRQREAAWTLALSGPVRRLDAAHATNGEGTFRWFASAGGIGFDAQVAASMAVRRGWQASRAGYLLTTLAELRRFENRPIRLTVDGEAEDLEVLFVAIANGSYYGGGMRIAPDASPDDGRLDVCVVGNVSRLTALGQIPNLYRGTHVRHPAVSMRTGATVSIDGDSETRVHLDGEPFGTLPLRVRVVPAAVDVAAPPASAR